MAQSAGRVCVYCGGTRRASLSREHVISKTAMEVPFGKEMRNWTFTVQGKKLMDHEQTIKDVCSRCNSDLSDFDDAGAKFVRAVDGYIDLTGCTLPFGELALSWLLKTHLNLIRLIPDKATGERYSLDPQFFANLLQHSRVPTELYRLYIEGIQGTSCFWDPDTGRNIDFFSYKSVRFVAQRILVSNLRVKALDTFLFIPADNDYRSFSDRCDSVDIEMYVDFGFRLQHIRIEEAIEGSLDIRNIVSLNEMLAHVRRVTGDDMT